MGRDPCGPARGSRYAYHGTATAGVCAATPRRVVLTGAVVDAAFWARVPKQPTVVVESPRWSVVKRKANGRVDFISPLPTPFNYGCIPDIQSGDGDPLDAVVLGPRLPAGMRIQVPMVAVVDFWDNGEPDPKVVCSTHPFSAVDQAQLVAFFTLYAQAKRALWLVRGRKGKTAFCGFLPRETWRPNPNL